MDCFYQLVSSEGGRHRLRCVVCGHERAGPYAEPNRYHRRCPLHATGPAGNPFGGPGTELMGLLAGLGIRSKPKCTCKARAKQMDSWGIARCREHFEEIVGWMRDGAPKWKWTEKLTAAALATASGLAFKLNWADPFPSLIEEAIRRADAKRGPPITRLNLCYHLLPKPHPLDVWQWNVRQLVRRWHLFTGRKLVTVCTGDGLDVGAVAAMLPPDAELLPVHNVHRLRDSVNFGAMLTILKSERTDEATFVGHSKGTTHEDQSAVRPWTQELYRHNLDRWPEVAELLRLWPIVGACKQYHHHLASWHYVGAFYTFRHDTWYSNPKWSHIDPHGWGLETHPAKLIDVQQAYCLAYDGITAPYTAATWAGIEVDP